jgi:hypothetical protein
VLLFVALVALGTFLDWELLVADSARKGISASILLVLAILTVAVYLLLMWLIAHRRSTAAKWIWIVITIFSLIMTLVNFSDMLRASTLSTVMQIAQALLVIVSVWLLFRPDASAWFRKGDAPAN